MLHSLRTCPSVHYLCRSDPIRSDLSHFTNRKSNSMGRGVSSGGGQSSLGYLFGGGEAPAPTHATNNVQAPPPVAPVANHVIQEKPPPAAATVAPPPADGTKQIPAGIHGSQKNNNYFRSDGQNTGNFITDRPSTKVHAAPGGGSSLNYLFGGGSN